MDFLKKLKDLVGEREEAPPQKVEPLEEASYKPSFNKLGSRLSNNNKPDYFSEEGLHPEDTFLRNISHIESSGGKNLEHKEIESGLHKGTAAIGRYGIMPKTAKDISGMLKNKQSMLKMHLGDNYSDPEVEELSKLDDKEVVKLVANNPKLEQRLARYLATRIGLMEGDELDKAYRWNMGHNIKKVDIDPKSRDEHQYIRKYKQLIEKSLGKAKAPKDDEEV